MKNETQEIMKAEWTREGCMLSYTGDPRLIFTADEFFDKIKQEMILKLRNEKLKDL